MSKCILQKNRVRNLIPFILFFCVIVIQVDGFGKEGYVMKLDIRSAAFEEGESIPKNIHVMALMFHRNCLGRNHLKEQKAWH